MPIAPPGAGVSEFVAFAVVDELLRTMVDRKVLTRVGAAALLQRTINNVQSLNLATGDKAVPVLQEMLDEYRQ